MMKQDIETTQAQITIYKTRKDGEYKLLVKKYNKDFTLQDPKFSIPFKSEEYGEELAKAVGEHLGFDNAYTLNDFSEVA